MGRLPVAAILVALCACQQGLPPRVFSDEQVAALEKQVLAKVAESPRDCVQPEIIEVFNRPKSCRTHEAECAESVARILPTVKEGCSPWQVGIAMLSDDVEAVGPLEVARFLSQRALAQPKTYESISLLLDAVAALQTSRRGYVNLWVNAVGNGGERLILDAIQKSLSSASLSSEQLAAITARVDHLLDSEPPIVETFIGELRTVALYYGVAPLKGEGWAPPGGRTNLFGDQSIGTAEHHDPIDDHAAMMAVTLAAEDRITQLCRGSLETCQSALAALPRGETTDDELDRGMTDKARLIEDGIAYSLHIYRVSVEMNAVAISRLAGLRMQLESMRTHECPSPIANVQVRRVEHGIEILPPSWVEKQQAAWRISCP